MSAQVAVSRHPGRHRCRPKSNGCNSPLAAKRRGCYPQQNAGFIPETDLASSIQSQGRNIVDNQEITCPDCDDNGIDRRSLLRVATVTPAAASLPALAT